jgi:hypothetical protein
MTAPAPTRPGLTTLDSRISQALAALRLARTARARSKTADRIRAEERAEADLNALLDYRYVVQER